MKTNPFIVSVHENGPDRPDFYHPDGSPPRLKCGKFQAHVNVDTRAAV